MITADHFYGQTDGPLKQGDILLAGVSRLVAEDRFTPPQWDAIEEHVVTVEAAKADGSPLRVGLGPALVMVTSHDCHLDKEWNRRRRELLGQGLSERAAAEDAERDTSLDRTFLASPLIDPDESGVERGNLMAGRVVGYLPVPASNDGLVPESVVDLTYRCTLDRLDMVRVSCVSNSVRAQLRYALARLDSLRATQLGFEAEAVLGQRIVNVEIPTRDPLLVRIHLDNETSVDLLQQPAEPPEAPSRSVAPPGSGT